MPQIADVPRLVERDDDRRPSVQSFVFQVPDGSHWEMQIANTVLSFNVAPGPASATPTTLPARVRIAVAGTRLYGAPLEGGTAEARLLTWPQEAALVYPNNRTMTDQEQAAYKNFRLRKLRRV